MLKLIRTCLIFASLGFGANLGGVSPTGVVDTRTGWTMSDPKTFSDKYPYKWMGQRGNLGGTVTLTVAMDQWLWSRHVGAGYTDNVYVYGGVGDYSVVDLNGSSSGLGDTGNVSISGIGSGTGTVAYAISYAVLSANAIRLSGIRLDAGRGVRLMGDGVGSHGDVIWSEENANRDVWYYMDDDDGGALYVKVFGPDAPVPTQQEATPGSVPTQQEATPERSTSTGGLGDVAAVVSVGVGNAVEATVEGNGGDELDGEVYDSDVTEFRFGLAPQRLKMDIRSLNKGALISHDLGYGDYGNMLKALETSLGATKAMANLGNGMSLWASGVYAQGRNKVLLGNPSAADKHYGIMMGTHYYHKPSRQLIGIAFDVGLGGSRANFNHKLKSVYRSAEATLYYSLGLTHNWKISTQVAHMLIRANNNRPYGNNNAVATSNAKSSHTSALVETNYKFKPSGNLHLSPSVGLRLNHTKQNAYSEKNAGAAENMSFGAATMTELSLKTGFKVSLFHKVDESTIYGLYPEIAFTRYLKAGRMRQRAGLVNNGSVHILESGTPGKNLLTLGMGAGVTNSEDGTKYQIGYTANFQKYRTSQEIMLKGSWQF